MFGHSAEGTESSEGHGQAIDSIRRIRSLDVRHRCSDEQSNSIRVIRISQSIAGMLQRLLLLETAVVLFRIDPHLDDPPRGCPVGHLLFAPMEIAGDTEDCPRQLGLRRGDLCWHSYFSHFSVRTIDSPRHQERVQANDTALRTNTMTIAAAAFAACPLGSRSSGGKCAPAEHGSARLLHTSPRLTSTLAIEPHETKPTTIRRAVMTGSNTTAETSTALLARAKFPCDGTCCTWPGHTAQPRPHAEADLHRPWLDSLASAWGR